MTERKLVAVSLLAYNARTLAGYAVLSVPADAAAEAIRDLTERDLGDHIHLDSDEDDTIEFRIQRVEITAAGPGAVPDATVGRGEDGALRVDDEA
jgi:hypothetical protein